ncbi:ParB/RepB/Spo0J family partition protein [Salipaludibacillus sp. LMS25]|jgi:ParB family chromosome partitioning protein|uniref:ParB/RepB/Spo0J family partition protein n=1 Tax=Salipaludibacillus sp. LMS25 TaxID=2924031 RepID=UPI0020D04EB9|nr:ParB/RepB/Spo0J family partition protein [Salipaludibacillus sp. LMS25]UTR16575.1 ParB/RepB/Spo0J family partition protein [Salipaludibacillus sp. LMS25]
MAKGLGKGISAFFPDAAEEQEGKIEEIKLSDLRPNPYQPRKTFEKEAIQELMSSVKQHGIIQPLIVRKSIKGYDIVVGERRYRAAKEAKLKVVPAIVKELSEDDMMEIALIENLQREDLNPLEEAKAYQKLMEHLQVTQEELAKRLGKSRPHIANYVRLLQLPQLAQQYLSEGKLSMGHARALLGLKNQKQLTPLIQKVLKERMSVRQLEEWIQRSNEDVSRETSKKKLSPFLKEKESTLKAFFGTNVQIKKGRKKGKIEIEFFSDEDLQRILELIHQTDDE